jgi:hypothetical protein
MLKTRRRYVETVEANGEVCEFHVNPADYSASLLEKLWELYEESLSINESVQEQVCYTRDTFWAALRDPDYHNVVMIIDGEPMGLTMATDNVDKMRDAYINPKFMRARFPDETERSGILYVTNSFLSPRLRNLGLIQLFVDVVIRPVAEDGYHVAFDVCERREFMVEFFTKALDRAGYPVETELLGRQQYYIFKPLNAGRG